MLTSFSRSIVVVLLFLIGSTTFTIAYCQAPLYYSNQNQYFLHGMAQAGVGSLDEDWLANTTDPTPLFSGLVALTLRHLSPDWFYLQHGLLLGIYAVSLFGLFVYLVGSEPSQRRWPIFCLLLVLAHCAVARWLSYRLVNFDYPWFLQAGVAGQYLLGSMLQPSVFGVLLVAAVCAFVHDRPYLAGFLIASSATLHSTYLLSGAMLTCGMLACLLVERRLKTASAVAALTLVLVLPVVAYVLIRFAPTSAETFATAQDVLVNVRIPHHSRPDLWLDGVAWAQIAWMVVGIALSRRTRLFPVLLAPFVLSALLTLLQAATGSATLALLFPWRISAVLVPIATTVILSRLVTLPLPALEGSIIRWISLAGIVGLVAGGVWINVNRQGFRGDDDELPLLEFVKRTREPGQTYLLPVRIPELAKTTRGSLSSDFKPLVVKKSDSRVIPVDLQRFRLTTGAPIFIDFKSIPYRDVEVIEWLDRLKLAQRLNEELNQGRVPLAELRQAGITHVVRPAGDVEPYPELEKVFEDSTYRLCEVKRKD